MIYKIRILPYGCFLHYSSDHKSYFMMQNYEQLIEYFFPKIEYKIVNRDEKADICITSIDMDDNSMLKDDEFNIFISIENITNKDFKWYKHYNKYREFGDSKINMYIYSHLDKLIQTDKYLSIPCIYSRINYFIKNYEYYYNNTTLNKTFNEKKFCIMINKSGLNPLIEKVRKILNNIANVDFISSYNSTILNKSCYNSIELLQILNQYKFAICFENSSCDGYITEKIFNCFFAKTIPIYWGSNKSSNYLNDKSYIIYNNENTEWLDKIKLLNTNENEYNKCINMNKINSDYNDENYKEIFIEFMKKKIKNE